MSAQHTPGPWHTDPTVDHEAVLSPKSILVADCAVIGQGRTKERNQANARLIAAAPALLAALESIDKFITALGPAKPTKEEASIQNVARGAIAAAKGETFTTGQARQGVAP